MFTIKVLMYVNKSLCPFVIIVNHDNAASASSYQEMLIQSDVPFFTKLQLTEKILYRISIFKKHCIIASVLDATIK